MSEQQKESEELPATPHDAYFDLDYDEYVTCEYCGGEGVIITCCDDLCVGGGHCIHGDGEDICPVCDGDGTIRHEFDPQ